MLFQFIKTMTSEMLKTTVLYHSSLYALIFEHLIYNVMYDFLPENNILSPNWSGLRSGYSWINQLLSINYKILDTFIKELKFVGYFSIFQRLLTKYGMMVFFFKLHQHGISGVSYSISLTLYKTFFATKTKSSFE